MASTAEPVYNPPLSGGGAAAQDDGVTVIASPTAYNFVDTGSLQFVLTQVGTVAKVEGNVLAAGGPPTGAAGGDLAGTYPNPTIGTDKVVTAKILDANVTDAKLANMTARSLKGRAADSTGVPGTISGAGAGTVPIDGGGGSTVAFGVLTRILQNLTIEGDITPAQIVADQNDYNPASLATAAVLRLDTDAARSITGLAGGSDGRIMGVLYIGANSLVLPNQNAGSAVANRFLFGADITLLPEQALVLIYDSTSSRWRALSRAFAFTPAPASRSLTAGAGLTGGGDLSADRTFNVVANADASITVNADDIQVAALGISAAKIAANAVTDAKLRQGAARTVIGVTGNATADVADIQGTADQVLRVNGAGTALAFGTVATAGHADTSITDVKLANMAALTVKGRSANSAGVPADIAAVAASGAVLRESGSTVAFGTIVAAGIAADAVTTVKVLDANVTDAKLANMGALTVKGRSANSIGVPADIAASAASGAVLRESGSTIGFGTVASAGLAAGAVIETKLATVIGNVAFTLTDAATIAVNRDNGKNQTVTLGANRTMGIPTGTLIDGMFLIFAIRQDATGSRTITFATGTGGFRATGGCSLTPTISTGASKLDFVVARYDATDNKWDLVQLTLAA